MQRQRLADFFESYKLTGETFGVGANGAVYACVDKAGAQFVAKLMSPYFVGARDGIAIHIAVSHLPHVHPVTALYRVDDMVLARNFPAHEHSIARTVVRTSRDYYTLVVSPRASLGDLNEVLVVKPKGMQTADDIVRVFAQVANGVAAVHATGHVHFDIKVDNVLVHRTDDGKLHATLADFDLACKANTVRTMTGYNIACPPEMVNGFKNGVARVRANCPADVWQMGMMLYHMLTGKYPLPHDQRDLESHAAWLEAVRGGKFTYPETLGYWQKSLLKTMLVYDEAARATMAEVLKHPLIQHCVRGVELPHVPPKLRRIK